LHICSVCAGKIRPWLRALIFLHFITARPARAKIVPLKTGFGHPIHGERHTPQNVYTLPPLKTLDLETFPLAAFIIGILVIILFLKIFKRITPLMVAGYWRIGTTIAIAQSNDTFKISIAVDNEEKYISLILMELPFAAQE
jgi:hypothetical protein